MWINYPYGVVLVLMARERLTQDALLLYLNALGNSVAFWGQYPSFICDLGAGVFFAFWGQVFAFAPHLCKSTPPLRLYGGYLRIDRTFLAK